MFRYKKWTRVEIKNIYTVSEKINILTGKFDIKPEILSWLDENASGIFFNKWKFVNSEYIIIISVLAYYKRSLRYPIRYPALYFKNPQTAILFKLTFL